MSTIARLSEAGAKLLLRLIETDGASGSINQTCAGAGISRASYYRARSQLESLGYIDGTGTLLRFRGQVEQPLEPVPVVVEEFTLRQRAMLSDNLPWSGDVSELMKSGSHAQKRKRQQTALLVEIMKTITGRSISAEEAKKIITATGESVEAALDLVEEMQRRVVERGLKVDWPGSYVLRMASNKRDEAKAQKPAQSAPATPPWQHPAEPIEAAPFRDKKAERQRAQLRAAGLAEDTEWD